MEAGHTPQQIIAAIKACNGLIAATARRLKCSRQTIYNYRDQYPEVAEAMVEAREFTADTAETSLFRAIKKGEPWAVCFYLKTQGKGRGYTEKSEMSGDIRVTVAYERDSTNPAAAASGPEEDSF